LTLAALAALAMGIASLPAVARAQGLTPEPALALEMTDRPAVTWMPKPFPVPNSEAKAEGEMKEYAESLPSSEVKFDMAPIKGGKFKIGSPVGEKGHKDDEGPQVEVVIEPFWMGKFEVTWEEYDSWASELDKQRRSVGQVAPTEWDKLADAVAYPTKPYSDMTFGMGKDRRPAVCMTQYAAQTYCKWLCGKTGRYYRLATEAEWEYACRAGTTTAYSFGDDPSQLKDYAVFADNSGEKYAKVGTKKPNPWGLYDMHGNVAEWVLDQYVADAYKKADGASLVCPWCKPTKEYPCVVRGGSWDDDKPEALRCAARLASNKDWKQQDPQLPQSIWYMTNASHVGFRVVRPLRMPTEAESRAYEPDPQIRLDYKKAQGGKS
jgi:formylglycine-generating enzyme required for sulfatase activity